MIYLLFSFFVFSFSISSLVASQEHIQEVIEETAMRTGFKRNLILALNNQKLEAHEVGELQEALSDQFRTLMPALSKSQRHRKTLHWGQKDMLMDAINYQHNLIMEEYAYLKRLSERRGQDFSKVICPAINERVSNYCVNRALR